MYIKIISIETVRPCTPIPSTPAGGMIKGRTPPATTGVTIIAVAISITKSDTEPALAVSPSKPPTEIRRVAKIEAP